MKHLLIYSDPNKDTISHEILEMCRKTLEQQGAQIMVRDLSDQPMSNASSIQNPIQNPNYQEQMDIILQAQKEVMTADKITFICGVWKGMLAKNLKDYLDQVFTQQFSYNMIAADKNGVTCKKQIGIISIELIPDNEDEAKEFDNNHQDIQYKDVIEKCGAPLEFHLTFEEYKANDDVQRKQILDQVTRTIEQFVSSPASNHTSKWDMHI